MSSASTYLRQMSLGDMDAVCEIEKTAYSHPWSRGNFEDSLRSGYWAQVLVGEDQSLWGYVVAMPGVQETHLDRKSTRLNSSHSQQSRMPSSA